MKLKGLVFFVVLSVLSFFLVTASYAQTNIDAYLMNSITVDKISGKALSIGKSDDMTMMKDVFIKAEDVAVETRAIRDMGGKVHMTVGDIISASIPSNSIKELARDVAFMEASKPVTISNDLAAVDINSTEVQKGTELPQGYTGKGVIIGIIDTGIDYTHPDFLDENGKSRILAIWNQNRNNGPSPSEIDDSYGTECDIDSIADGSCPLNDYEGHGTHVSGTAAGNDEKYKGVAPDANIIVVSYDSSMNISGGYANTIFSTKICQGAYYIFKKAEEYGMPAVINMSLGTHIGPHDGRSLFEQCLSGLVEGTAGRAIVAAAGNETSIDRKSTGIHAGYDVDGTMATAFKISKKSNQGIYYIDFWGSKDSDISVGLASYEGKASAGKEIDFSELVAPGGSKSGSMLDGKIQYSIGYTETKSAVNGKPHAGIEIKLVDGAEDILSGHEFALVISGSGSFNAWMFPDKPSKIINFQSESGHTVEGWNLIAGDRGNSISIPATDPDVIAVGAYTTRNKWGDGCCEVALPLDDILDFSSSGPTADPEYTGVKPDITAPGAMIASAMSRYAVTDPLLVMKDGKHFLQSGTSMAAPFVTGTIALLFSADPNFTFQDVKKYLVQGAYVDDYVGDVPNNRWGNGKLDVLATLEDAIKGGSSGHFESNPSLSANTTPSADDPLGAGASSGHSGCYLSKGATVRPAGIAVFLFMNMFLLIAILFARKHQRA